MKFSKLRVPVREPVHFIDWIQRSSNSFSVPCTRASVSPIRVL